MTKVDVLNLEFTSHPSRDRQTATLVCNYLRVLGYNVIEGSVHDGFHLIQKHKPKVFFISNTIGAKVNFNLVKYCHYKGIKVISSTSEGNMQESFIEQFFWGNNKDKILYEDLHLQWTTRTRDLSVKYYPQVKSKIKVAGAAGFDIFRIAKLISKEDFLNKYSKETFKKTIGIGCWDFGLFDPNDTRYELIKKRWNKEARERFKSDGKAFNKLIIETVRNNPDILFILKEHPGNQIGLSASGIEGCEEFKNTLILKKEPLTDCISASDLWLTYESTTVIEAWLLNKQTGLINPSGIDFPRANVHFGSPNFESANILQTAITNFYKTNELDGFESLTNERSVVMKEVIQWDDGLNHVRIGNEIMDFLNTKPKKVKFRPFLFLKQRLIQRLASTFPKRFAHEYEKQQSFNNEELSDFSKTRYSQQINYYKDQGYTIDALKKIRAI